MPEEKNDVFSRRSGSARMGGPKLKIVAVGEDHIVAVQASNEQGEKYTLKPADVTPYKEEGDFGVC
jgi:predicted SPOUT superfamily RNA methylase MTH1